MMTQEKAGLDKDVKQWETQFKKKNGREPTAEDKYISLVKNSSNRYLSWQPFKEIWNWLFE